MAEQLLDKASYSIIRTNPKLTGNVKVVSDGTDIYLESFSANTRLSSQKFKAFKVDSTSTYDQDVFRFFDSGKFPAEAAYEIFQEFDILEIYDDILVLGDVKIKKNLSKNILSDDFYDSISICLSTGKIEFSVKDTVVDWIYLKLTTCEQGDC